MKQHRYEELFIPNTMVSDTSQLSSPSMPQGEFIIIAEHCHDLELWRREICERGRREGVYLGQTGTFVMKEWEVAVLLGCVLFEGELEERAIEIVEEWGHEFSEKRFKHIHTAFGKLNPWKMGWVIVQPLVEAETSTDRKPHRNGPKQLLSAIRLC
jgi:spore cortex formation protein SpoVR/YcgB (stage V sporulation)